LHNKSVLLIVAIFASATFLFSNPKAFGSSTISQSYKDSLFLPSGKEMLELFRYQIDLAIQTEPDETWRNNTAYEGRVLIGLDWYNPALFPYGICVKFWVPEQSFPSSWGVNWTFSNHNITLDSALGGKGWWGIRFETPSLHEGESETFSYEPRYSYTVYNASSWIGSPAPYVGQSNFDQPTIYITIADSTRAPTYQQVADLNQQVANLDQQVVNLKGSLVNTQNLVYVLIVLVAVSIVVNVVLGHSNRKLRRTEAG